MKAESIKYVLVGVLIAILMMFIISAKENGGNENRRYQITSSGDNWHRLYVVDTQTGLVKKVVDQSDKLDQLGKTFDEMKPE
jgi:hypothetical protein